MTAIATIIPITKQSIPFTQEPDDAGVLVIEVEDMNGVDVVGVIPRNN